MAQLVSLIILVLVIVAQAIMIIFLRRINKDRWQLIFRCGEKVRDLIKESAQRQVMIERLYQYLGALAHLYGGRYMISRDFIKRTHPYKVDIIDNPEISVVTIIYRDAQHEENNAA